jgi:Fe-S-cluster formation regulator IscX/YfhJ
VNPVQLTKSLISLWEGEYKNISSKALELSWSSIATSFNRCTTLNSNGVLPPKRIVVAAPTGSGKTALMVQYASQLDITVGMLIVTSFIDEADKIVKDVNKHSNSDKAIAFHSDSDYWRKDDELKNHQILVITHNQFVGATDRSQNEVGIDRSKIHKLYAYLSRNRDLVVIDESIETIQSVNVEYSDIHQLITHLKGYVDHKDFDEGSSLDPDNDLKLLKRLVKFLDESKQKAGSRSELPIDSSYLIRYLDGCTLTLLASKKLNDNGKLSHGNRDVKRRIGETINNIKTIMGAEWLYYTIKDEALRTARDTLPDTVSTVILDATSSINHYYNVHSDIEKVDLPSDIRNYQNLELFLSVGQKTGGSDLAKDLNLKAHAQLISNEIDKPFNKDKIAVFTFSKLEDKVKEILSKSDLDNIIELNHFGNLNGKNEYQNCNTLYIIGTHFMPKYVTTNTHALSLIGHIACFNDDPKTKQERLLLEYTNISANIIQAVNRISCRNVIDSYGNCPPTKVYLTLPDNDNLSRNIVDSIKLQMPHVQIKEWDFVLLQASRRGTKGEFEDLFMKEIKQLTGSIKFSSMVKDLHLNGKKITTKQKEGLRNRLTTPKHNDPIIQVMKECGVRFSNSKPYNLVKDKKHP